MLKKGKGRKLVGIYVTIALFPSHLMMLSDMLNGSVINDGIPGLCSGGTASAHVFQCTGPG